jgi:RNA polymerase sigma-70 factor (ECF subfamily)
MTSAVEMPSQELKVLMQAYQAGDAEAAGALIVRLSPALYRFFAANTGDRRHAEDLLQDTWLRIHKARHTYRPGEAVLPWVYSIARHARVDAYRRRRSERYEQTGASLPDVAEPTAGGHAFRDLPDIETMLAMLPESQREVISMLKISGLTLEEVARATSSSVGSVKQKAHRAYEKLRAALAAGGPAGRKAVAE